MRPIKLMSPGRAVIIESPLRHALRLSNHDNHVRHFKKRAKESLGGQTPRRIKLEEAEKKRQETDTVALPSRIPRADRLQLCGVAICSPAGNNHVSLLSQTRGCSDGDHQEGHTRRRLRGQIHREKVSLGSGCLLPKEATRLSMPPHLSSPSPLGATGASMATTAGRRSICSRRWSPLIRRPCSLT